MYANEDRDIYMTSNQLRTAYHVQGNIASNNDGDANNSWDLAFYYPIFWIANIMGLHKRISQMSSYTQS